jgi:hypothetical protein
MGLCGHRGPDESEGWVSVSKSAVTLSIKNSNNRLTKCPYSLVGISVQSKDGKSANQVSCLGLRKFYQVVTGQTAQSEQSDK